jgi:hypothetical protein
VRTSDAPDQIVRRILIGSRVIAMAEIARTTSRFFADAQRQTGASPAAIAEAMEKILDRDAALDPPLPWLKRRPTEEA